MTRKNSAVGWAHITCADDSSDVPLIRPHLPLLGEWGNPSRAHKTHPPQTPSNPPHPTFSYTLSWILATEEHSERPSWSGSWSGVGSGFWWIGANSGMLGLSSLLFVVLTVCPFLYANCEMVDDALYLIVESLIYSQHKVDPKDNAHIYCICFYVVI